LPTLPFLVQDEVKDQTAGRRDQTSLVLDAKLPFRKDRKLTIELFLRPWFHPGKASLLERNDAFEVVRSQPPERRALFVAF
jgi:hypothetical protein